MITGSICKLFYRLIEKFRPGNGRQLSSWPGAWKSGNPKPKQNFINSKMGEDWEEREKKTELDVIRIHIGQYSADSIPDGVQMITAGVDVQIDHVWAAIIGWGYMSEAWNIFETRLETGDTQDIGNYQLLRMLLAKTWPLPGKANYNISIAAAGVDCNYRPDTVKDFCRLITETTIYPVRGDDTVWSKMFRAVKIEGTSLYRYDLNVNAIKDRLYRLLYESKAPGAGYFHLNKDTTEETLAHLTSEEQKIDRHRRREQKVWKPKTEHSINHLWDCYVYAAAAAELAGVRMLGPIEPEKEKKRTVIESDYKELHD
jgi:phage terminase large subunit GpA-like protein